MSYAQFLGQPTPVINAGSLNLADNNWISYLTTPDLNTPVNIPSGTSVDVFLSPVIPAGYWNFVLAWELQAQTIGQTITNYEIAVGNNLTAPSALPIWSATNPTGNIQFYQTNITNNSIVNDVISGMIWSDGTDNSKIRINVGATTSGGSAINWMNWNNAESFPCLSLFKIG